MTGLFGVEALVLVAFGLLVLGVVGSVVPAVPGAGLSLAGVYLYWWQSGYAEPSGLVLAAITLGGVFAVAFDWFGSAIATGVAGGSTRSVIAAGLVGAALFFVAGPFGVVLGIGATVFALELVGGNSPRRSFRTAAYATAGVLASAAVQLFVTASILLIMIAVAVL